MTLIVCPLHAVDDEIERSSPARLVSLLSPDQTAPEARPGVPQLTLRFHDIARPRPGFIAPNRAMVADILAFGAAWSEPGHLLVHCWMGISRSTAAALILACAANPSRAEADVARELRRASPAATPNPLIVMLADELLERDGRLVAAAAAIGRGEEAACGSPFRLVVRRPSIAARGRRAERSASAPDRPGDR
jgi:predicted protein tyrosine phosphatase